ncbi:MAG: protein translocase subunit SecF [Nanoarchaeota archaeon]|nr:protein translocase subunit SecF [Nanoarchaeota archaeon]
MSRLSKFHDKYYKSLLLITLVLIVLSIVYMGAFYSQNKDFIKKDISLTGGTSITVYGNFSAGDLELALSPDLPDLNVRQISDITTREQKALVIETTLEGEAAKKFVEDYLGFDLIEGENSDFEFTGSSLSESFYKQLIIAIIFAFVLMALVVFILFRTFIPSMAVIISAFADILMTLVVINMMGTKVSTAGIVAFLMLIGYSVDTDILLTTRLLKRKEGSLNQRLFGAFKTGITMTLTSFAAMLIALFVVRSFSAVLTQIFTVLVIGLAFDMLNTWITNASILKWYVRRKEK